MTHFLKMNTTPKKENTPAMEFEVQRSDIDFLEHVNNVRYVEWILQTIPKALRGGHELDCLEVQFRKEAVYSDRVRVETFLEKAHAQHRVIHIERQEELVQATSRWRKTSVA